MPYELKSQNDTPEKEMPDSYYQKGIEGFVSKWGYALHSAKNWRFFALGLLLCNFASIGATTYFATRSTLVPYIVEVDASSGAVLNTSKMAVRSVAQDKEVSYFLWQTIRKIRTIPKDIVVYGNNWQEAQAFMSKNTAKKVQELSVSENHQEMIKKGETVMVSLKVMTMLPNQDGVYKVGWTETHYSPNGSKIEEYDMEGYFSIRQRDITPDTVYVNPMGLYIYDFNISQVSK